MNNYLTYFSSWFYGGRIRIVAISYLYFAVPYLLLNHYHITEPTEIYLFSFEKILPFIPSAIWVYLTDYFLPVMTLYLVREEAHLKRLIPAFFLLLALHYVVFFFYPTVYPRASMLTDTSGLTGFAFSLLHWIDTPANCFPSGHVSICFLCAFTMYHARRNLYPLFLLWATLISISTLFTKQHYFLDIIAAVILAYGVHYFFWRDKGTDNQKQKTGLSSHDRYRN